MKVINIRRRSNSVMPFVYIGRPSIWGNPFVIGKDGSRDEVIEKYEWHIRNRPDLIAQLPDLIGKDLGCYCHPLPCHGDVLIKLCAEFYPHLM